MKTDFPVNQKLEKEIANLSSNDLDMSDSDDDDETEDKDFMIYRINTDKDLNQVLRLD